MAESTIGMGTSNPESLHQISKSTASPTTSAFVNPGTPKAALVTREQISSAKIGGDAADILKAGMIKG